MFEGKVWFLRGAYLQWSTTHSLEQYSLSQSGLSIVGLLHPLRLHTDGFMWLSGPICNRENGSENVEQVKKEEMEDLCELIKKEKWKISAEILGLKHISCL